MPLQGRIAKWQFFETTLPCYSLYICRNRPVISHRSYTLIPCSKHPVLKQPFQDDILGRTLNIISRHFQFYIIRIERLSSWLQVLACYINKFTGISNALQKSDSNYKRLLNIFVAKVPGIAGILNSPFKLQFRSFFVMFNNVVNNSFSVSRFLFYNPQGSLSHRMVDIFWSCKLEVLFNPKLKMAF